jgi:hypothetical protein
MMERASQAIVDRLKSKFGADWKVDHFPDAPQRYTFGARGEELLVSYERSTYGAPESMAPISQRRDAEFAVMLVVRSLRGAKGAQETIENLRKALQGWRPTAPNEANVQVPLGMGPMIPKEDTFVGEDNGVWRFSVSFTSSAVAIQVTEPVITGPALSGLPTIREVTSV